MLNTLFQGIFDTDMTSFGLFIVCGMRACSWIDPGGNLHVWNKIHEEFRGNAGVASGSGLCSDHDGKWKCRNRRSSCGSV